MAEIDGFLLFGATIFYSSWAIQKGGYFNLSPCPAEGSIHREAHNVDREQKGVNVRSPEDPAKVMVAMTRNGLYRFAIAKQ